MIKYMMLVSSLSLFSDVVTIIMIAFLMIITGSVWRLSQDVSCSRGTQAMKQSPRNEDPLKIESKRFIITAIGVAIIIMIRILKQ